MNNVKYFPIPLRTDDEIDPAKNIPRRQLNIDRPLNRPRPRKHRPHVHITRMIPVGPRTRAFNGIGKDQEKDVLCHKVLLRKTFGELNDKCDTSGILYMVELVMKVLL